MSDAAGSGERKAIGENTHVSLRSAMIIGALGVVPLTLFIASLSAGQARLNDKIDSLINTMDIRRKNRDDQVGEIIHRVEDHEGRIRSLEARKL